MDIVRKRVRVEAKGVGLSWIRRGRFILSERRKRILDNLNFTCPAGQITAIMVSGYVSPKEAVFSNILCIRVHQELESRLLCS